MKNIVSDEHAPRLWISRDILSIPKFIISSMESASGECLASASDKLCYNKHITPFIHTHIHTDASCKVKRFSSVLQKSHRRKR